MVSANYRLIIGASLIFTEHLCVRVAYVIPILHSKFIYTIYLKHDLFDEAAQRVQQTGYFEHIPSEQINYRRTHNVQNNDVDRSHSKKLEVVSGAVGSGLHQKLILGSGVRNEKLRYYC